MFGAAYNCSKELKINELAAWKIVLGLDNVILYGRITNPLREDNYPGCWLYPFNETILLADFADHEFHGMTVYEAYAYKYNISLSEAIIQLSKLLSEEGFKLNHPTQVRKDKEAEDQITYTSIIHSVPKIFDNKPIYTQEDINYWASYGISIERLIQDNIRSVESYNFTDKYGLRHQIYPKGLCFSYVMPSGNIKIYSPTSDKLKWIANTNNNDIGYWNDLPDEDDILIISKSYKDAAIHKILGYNVIWTNNESPKCLPFWAIEDINKRFKTVIVIFDNDNTGIKSAKSIVTLGNQGESNTQWFSLIVDFVNDSAEYVKQYGLDSYSQFLNECLKMSTKAGVAL